MEEEKTLAEEKNLKTEAPTKKKGGRGCLIAVLVFFGFLFLLSITISLASLFTRGKFFAEVRGIQQVAVIRIEGQISGDYLNTTGASPDNVIEQLRDAEEDPTIKAIVLRINSPGGSAAASQEIAREIRRVRKPVVASIADVGASGAYWIASACDKIVCSPASSIGSIGVIMIIPNYEELLKKVGLKQITITKGKYKDIGNPARPMTDEEKELLEKQIEIVYEQFISEISKDRKLSRKKVESVATGQVFVGEEALRLRLVDKLGNFRDAVLLAGNLAGIKGEPDIREMYPTPKSFFDLLKFLISGAKIIENMRLSMGVPVIR